MNPRVKAWKKWLAMPAHVNDAIGGDIQEERSMGTIRGRIKTIELQGYNLVFTAEWTAAHVKADRWRVMKGYKESALMKVITCDLRNCVGNTTEDEDTGIIRFKTYLADLTLFPKRSGMILDPSKVQGL